MSHKIDDLVGIGPKSSVWLRSVGVACHADLERIGVVEAFIRVRAAGHPATMNLLWALQGALQGIHWTMVPPKVRNDLKEAVASRTD